MIVLCDTCTVLMLIRIAPEMFCDERYECVTIQAVRREMFSTPRFKQKYPWQTEYKSKIKAVSTFKQDSQVASAVHMAAENNLNEVDGRPYGLSHADKEVASYAVSNSWGVATGDGGLLCFLPQQFDVTVYSALEVLNIWLKKGITTWSDEMDRILRDWVHDRERPQPEKAKREFKKLTGKKYPGP